jgi:hypothetical protein
LYRAGRMSLAWGPSTSNALLPWAVPELGPENCG